jgi:hypothetical protein
MKIPKTTLSSTLCVAALATAIGCAENQPTTHAASVAAPAPIVQTPVSETEAKAILMRMAEFLAKTPQFTVNVKDGYDSVQASGQKIEFGEHRKITVSRPNGLRVDMDESNGDQHTVLYDGKQLTIFNPGMNVYAQTEKTGGIDEAVKYFLKDLHMRLPLAMLLTGNLPTELENRTQALTYVEKTALYGVVTHHLAGRTETVDYQVWIADGSQPLPVRIVLTYKTAEGQPQFRALFSDWNLTSQVSDTEFAFTPPAGAQKIAFVEQLPGTKTTGAKTGGQ